MKEIDIILKNIKNKELLPVYFFQGDEAFYIDLAVKHFEQDVLELLDRLEFGARRDAGVDLLARRGRQGAQLAGRYLRVLVLEGSNDVGRHQGKLF